nr:BFH_HP1_G0048590.mRNA.1.CDS.1 [Saccharomyces cerevisiae]
MTFTVLSDGMWFFVNAKVMPVYVRWIKYIVFAVVSIWYSHVKYLYELVLYCCDNLDECLVNQILKLIKFRGDINQYLLLSYFVGLWDIL